MPLQWANIDPYATFLKDMPDNFHVVQHVSCCVDEETSDHHIERSLRPRHATVEREVGYRVRHATSNILGILDIRNGNRLVPLAALDLVREVLGRIGMYEATYAPL